MCGIVAFIGDRPAIPVLLGGLARLEYRGYDSAGVCVVDDDRLDVVRQVGKLSELSAMHEIDAMGGSAGIGHTRWATHGKPSVANGHPHTNCDGTIAIVHNGIIENHDELRDELSQSGCRFTSQTDSEVIAHLIGYILERNPGSGLVAAVRSAVLRLDGSFAIAVQSSRDPSVIVGARRQSPLIAGRSGGAGLLASDISAILCETRDVVIVDDDQIVELRKGCDPVTTSFEGAPVDVSWTHVDWDLDAAERGGYDDFMLKEIYEQPRAIKDTLRDRIDHETGRLVLDEFHSNGHVLDGFDKVFVVACGTSYHAGLVAKYAIEHWVRVPVEIDIASEFRYRDPVLDSRTLVIGISQSGETTDTIEAMRYARDLSARVIVVSNVVESTMAREADAVIYTHAGPEIGVAATKTFTAQIAALIILALYLAQIRGALYAGETAHVIDMIARIPDQVEQLLSDTSAIEEEAHRWSDVTDAFFLGRGPGYPTALEGALKMKEITYLHAEAYAAGELKHGPLALIEDGVPVIADVTMSKVSAKTLSNVAEVAARGGRIILLKNPGTSHGSLDADTVFTVPPTHELLAPILNTVVLQLLAYFVAKDRGCNVDKPRNLAKTVTVE